MSMAKEGNESPLSYPALRGQKYADLAQEGGHTRDLGYHKIQSFKKLGFSRGRGDTHGREWGGGWGKEH